MPHNFLGKTGEDIAAKYLINLGYRVIEKNFRAWKFGEIDIITNDPPGQTVFVEVKARIGAEFGRANESISAEKLRRLKTSIAYYIQRNPTVKNYRLDLIAITIRDDQSVERVEHLKNITL